MKTMRRISALLLALVMLFALTITVSAASDGTITINAATVGETYKIYKIFDATTQDGNIAYTYTKTGDTDALYTALIGENSPFTLTATADESKFNVSLKEGKIGSDVAVFLKKIEDKMGNAVAEQTAADTTVEFTGLDYGYYYIAKASTEKPGPTVGVTSVAPAQTINDKSTKPGPWTPDPDDPDPEDPHNPGGYKILTDENGKALENQNGTANYGDTVYFVLQAQGVAYNDGKKITKYVAYDELGEGFKDFAVVKVFVGSTELAPTSYTVDTSGSPYTVTIPWAESYGPSAKIKIVCSAVVDEDAIIGETDENTANTTNTGWFGWEYDTKDPTDPTKPEVEEDEDGKKTVTTKVYAIAIYKTDATGNALAGANFEIYKGETKVPVTLVDAGNETDAAVYKYDADSSNYTVISPASGKILIKGLEGVQYFVKETVAPAGYNLLTDSVEVTAAEFASSSTTIYFDDDGNVIDQETENKVVFDETAAAKHIINQSGAELPTTGGMGTTMFYAFGSVLVLAAVVLLVTKKRMAV